MRAREAPPHAHARTRRLRARERKTHASVAELEDLSDDKTCASRSWLRCATDDIPLFHACIRRPVFDAGGAGSCSRLTTSVTTLNRCAPAQPHALSHVAVRRAACTKFFREIISGLFSRESY